MGHGVAGVVVANRTSDRTEDMVAGLPDQRDAPVASAPLDQLDQLLASADVVFTSVGTSHPIIDRPLLERALAERRAAEPLLVVDLGVPRNVEPQAAELDGHRPA